MYGVGEYYGDNGGSDWGVREICSDLYKTLVRVFEELCEERSGR